MKDSAQAPVLNGSAGYRMRGLQGRLIDALGEAIVSGRFQPGETLPREPELMAEYQVSRSSLREVLKVLAAKGLIETRQKLGTRVRRQDLWNVFDADVLAWHQRQGRGELMLRDLIELRQVIEPAAARLAAGRASMSDLSKLERSVATMRQSSDDLTAYAAADVEFHMTIFAASHNVLFARLAHVVADFLQISFQIQQQALNDDDNRIQDDVEGHQRIFEAINRGEGNDAAEQMLAVILNGKISLFRAIGEAQPLEEPRPAGARGAKPKPQGA
jgi:GntR family galactonate operon transcriptional repressor